VLYIYTINKQNNYFKRKETNCISNTYVICYSDAAGQGEEKWPQEQYRGIKAKVQCKVSRQVTSFIMHLQLLDGQHYIADGQTVLNYNSIFIFVDIDNCQSTPWQEKLL